MSLVSVPLSVHWNVDENTATLSDNAGIFRPPLDVNVTLWQPNAEPGELREVYISVTDADGHHLHDVERHGSPLGRFVDVTGALAVATAWYMGWLVEAASH